MLLWRARLALASARAARALGAGRGARARRRPDLWSYRTLLGKEPGITLLVVLMALKTLELRARRDAFVVFFLGFFLVLTHFLYSQSLPVAVAMLVSVWGLLTALVLAHMPVGQPSLRQAGAAGGAHGAARRADHGAAVRAVPAHRPAVGRAAGRHLDDRPVEQHAHGLGRRGRAATTAIALRVRFDGARAAAAGDVLPRPGADALRRRRVAPARAARRPRRARRRAPNLRVERHAGALRDDARAAAPGDAAAAGGDADAAADRRLRAELARRPAVAAPTGRCSSACASTPRRYAALHARRAAPTRRARLQDHVELPPGYNPRTLDWAARAARATRLRGAERAALARARAAAHPQRRLQLHAGARRATAATRSTSSGSTASEGFCEHFAAVVRRPHARARRAGAHRHRLPGRRPAPVDGYYIVRQSSAHAWAEYWQPGIGWVRADPTAAVAPDRINRSRALRAAARPRRRRARQR